MKKLLLFALAPAFGLALALVPSIASAQPLSPPAGATEGELEVSPLRVAPGDTVTVSGDGCGLQVPVEFKLYAPELISTGKIESSDTGFFSADIEIPTEVIAGRAWLVAECLDIDGEPLVLERTIVVTRPAIAITGVNLMFGGGTALIVGGLGIMLRRRLPVRRRRRVARSAR